MNSEPLICGSKTWYPPIMQHGIKMFHEYRKILKEAKKLFKGNRLNASVIENGIVF